MGSNFLTPSFALPKWLEAIDPKRCQPPFFFGNVAYVYIGVVPTGGQTYTYIYIDRCDLTRCCWKKTKFNMMSLFFELFRTWSIDRRFVEVLGCFF